MPAVTPVTIPDAEPIEIFPLLLLQVPPVVLHVKVVAEPTHTVDAPVTDDGKGLIVRFAVTKHEVLRV